MKKSFLFLLILLFYFQNVSAQKDSSLFAQTPDSSLKVLNVRVSEGEGKLVFLVRQGAQNNWIPVADAPVFGDKDVVDMLRLERNSSGVPVMIYFKRHRIKENGLWDQDLLRVYDIPTAQWFTIIE